MPKEQRDGGIRERYGAREVGKIGGGKIIKDIIYNVIIEIATKCFRISD